MKRRWIPWALFAMNGAFAAANLAVFFIGGFWLNLVIGIVCAACAAVCLGGTRRGSWRADRDDSSAYAGAHPQLGAYVAEPGEGTKPARAGARVVEEPIKAWKLARAQVMRDGSVVFQPSAYGDKRYGVEDKAVCALGERHSAPEASCSCGFYALKGKPRHIPSGMVLLEVELYGRVLNYTDGYRAEYQRVLSIEARASCSAWIYPDGYSAVRPPSGIIGIHQVDCGRDAPFIVDGRPLCAEHALAQPRRFYEWTPEPINCETEWRWVQ